jgi:hypothetical protein
MHTFGLAVDINYSGNPWIVGQHVDGAARPSPAGQVTQQANETMTRVVNRASLLISGRAVHFDVRYLSRLGEGNGGAAWDDLRRLDDAFRAYLRLAGDDAGIRAAVEARWDLPGIARPNEAIAQAIARWNSTIREDLRSLRLGSVVRMNAQGVNVSVQQSNFTGRNPLNGFLNLNRDLVVTLRDNAGLAWGAIDFGRESGDVMHFDCRRSGIGALLRRS